MGGIWGMREREGYMGLHGDDPGVEMAPCPWPTCRIGEPEVGREGNETNRFMVFRV